LSSSDGDDVSVFDEGDDDGKGADCFVDDDRGNAGPVNNKPMAVATVHITAIVGRPS
jgi:hypothetical protein